MEITATEFKTNLGKYIDIITRGSDEITVTKNGKQVMHITKPKPTVAEKLSSLIDDVPAGIDYDSIKKEALADKYEIDI